MFIKSSIPVLAITGVISIPDSALEYIDSYLNIITIYSNNLSENISNLNNNSSSNGGLNLFTDIPKLNNPFLDRAVYRESHFYYN